jgi:hypothetical protein
MRVYQMIGAAVRVGNREPDGRDLLHDLIVGGCSGILQTKMGEARTIDSSRPDTTLRSVD